MGVSSCVGDYTFLCTEEVGDYDGWLHFTDGLLRVKLANDVTYKRLVDQRPGLLR